MFDLTAPARAARLSLGVVLLGAAGCREPGSARYDGAIYNSSREVRGTGHLTIFSRADSSISAYLRADTSLGTTGRTVGWATPTGWHLETSTALGDTILWRGDGRLASLDGALLAGSYTVIGGPSAGEIGTFEWSLLRGRGLELPAQRSAFVSTAGMRLEAPLVVFAAALGVALFFVVYRWVQATPFDRNNERPVSPLARQLDGVGGWMGWFVFGQVVTTLMMLVRIREVWAPFENGTWVLMGTLSGMRAMLSLELAIHVMQIAVPIVGIVLTTRHRAEAPRLWFAYLSVLTIYAAVDLVATSTLSSGLRDILGDGAMSAERSVSGSVFANARAIVFCLLWLGYWASSQRVLVTFGGQALTEWRVGLTRPPRPQPALAGTPLGTDVTTTITASQA